MSFALDASLYGEGDDGAFPLLLGSIVTHHERFMDLGIILEVLERPLDSIELPARYYSVATNRHGHRVHGELHCATVFTRAELSQQPVNEEMFAIRKANQIGVFVTTTQRAGLDVVDFGIAGRNDAVSRAFDDLAVPISVFRGHWQCFAKPRLGFFVRSNRLRLARKVRALRPLTSSVPPKTARDAPHDRTTESALSDLRTGCNFCDRLFTALVGILDIDLMQQIIPPKPGGFNAFGWLSHINWGHGMIGKATVALVVLLGVLGIVAVRLASDTSLLWIVAAGVGCFAAFLIFLGWFAKTLPDLAATEGPTYVESRRVALAAKNIGVLPPSEMTPDPQNPIVIDQVPTKSQMGIAAK